MQMACGKRLPDSEHAVSVSLPTMADVVGYEESVAAVMRQICSGYPRFVRHWMVERVEGMLSAQQGGREVRLLHQPAALERLESFEGRGFDTFSESGLTGVALDRDDNDGATGVKRFLQHTGWQFSSRQAEDWLWERGEIGHRQQEVVLEVADPYGAVVAMLASISEVDEAAVRVYPTGMAGIYETVRGLSRLTRARVWIQVGWLYLDTGKLLGCVASETMHFTVDGLDELEAYLAAHHAEVAGVITEVMTNPLLQTPDLGRLSGCCRRYGIPLVVDVSMPGSVNVDVLPFADVVIESLTKFASGTGDVMGGAVILNRGTDWGGRLAEVLRVLPPYERDLRRLGYGLSSYRERMPALGAKTAALVEYWGGHPRVRSVMAATDGRYRELCRRGGGMGAVVSLVFDGHLAEVYDRLALCKGPSFGMNFTLCMPYVYMAHYDLVKTSDPEGALARHGVNPELLRVSVGAEPLEDIVGAFDEVWSS